VLQSAVVVARAKKTEASREAVEVRPAVAAEGVPEGVTEVADVEPTERLALAEGALTQLNAWKTLSERMLTEQMGRIVLPEEFDKDLFDSYRTIFYLFREAEGIRPVLYRWFMDNYWSPKQRDDVLRKWTRTIPEPETDYADTFRPVELFRGELRGYLVYDSGLQTFCFADGDTDVARCSDLFLPKVNEAIGAPVDRKSDKVMGTVYGFLTVKGADVIFKSVDMVEGKLSGAMCANTSNLPSHFKIIKKIQEQARASLAADDPFILSLLKDDDETNPTKKQITDVKEAYTKRYGGVASTLVMTHIKELNKYQACMYMEMLLRLMDARRVGGKRWFLSVVDSVRAGVKPL